MSVKIGRLIYNVYMFTVPHLCFFWKANWMMNKSKWCVRHALHCMGKSSRYFSCANGAKEENDKSIYSFSKKSARMNGQFQM